MTLEAFFNQTTIKQDLKIEINQIYNIDCLEGMKQLEDNSVDLVLTDPPYSLTKKQLGFLEPIKSGQSICKRTDYNLIKTDWIEERLTLKQFQEIQRVSKNQVIFGGNYFTDILPISRCWYVWDKRVEDKYSNDFSDCEYIWTSYDKPAKIIRYLWSGLFQQNMKKKETRYHPTQKPVAVIEELLKDFTKEGDLVLDPFLGSGTTAVACLRLQRTFIGFEIKKEYYQIAKKRIKPFTAEQKRLTSFQEVI